MDKLSIVKIGGNVIRDPVQLRAFLENFVQIAGAKILIHGGGKESTRMAERLGLETKMVDGRRVTDADTLDIITMIYGGKINKHIVAQLQALKCDAVGLSGADGNSIRAVKRPVGEVDFGFVGDVTRINSDFYRLLLGGAYVPVCCAISHDNKGQLLNTNADTIASCIAVELSASYDVALYYCFEKAGVMTDVENENSVLQELTEHDFERMKAEAKVVAGMIPKLKNCFDALHGGVKKVRVGSTGMIGGEEEGTDIIINGFSKDKHID